MNTITKTTVIFASCLPSCTSACTEKNMRLRPGIGLSTPNFGWIFFGANRKPNWSKFATIAITTAPPNATPISAT